MRNAGQGPTGPQGKPGKDGSSKGQGPQGPPGKDGKDGKSGKNGKDGKPGPQGKPGKDGKTPVKGRDYFDGKDGKPGPQGKPGKDGKDGTDGRDGKDGVMGPFGPRGAPGIPGPQGKQGPQGPPGKNAAPIYVVPIIPVIPPAPKPTCNFSLTWDAANSILKANLQIGDCRVQPNVKIPMDSNLENYLKDIQNKVTIAPPIQKGEATKPDTEGDWYKYQALGPNNATGLSDAFKLLSEQIENAHKDVCKGIEHKMTLPTLPTPITCQTDPITGETTTQSMSLESLAGLGWILPWIIPAEGAVGSAVVSYIISNLLDWLFKTNQKQYEDSLKIMCDMQNQDSCSVLIPDPSAVWNTNGYYLFLHWKIAPPVDEDGQERLDWMTKAEKEWKQRTQIASPLDTFINPSDADKIWGNYFAAIYQILGNQWGEIRSKDKAKRYPIYKGWFANVDEGRRFLKSIVKLSTIPYDDKNTPTFPLKDNQSTRIINQGKKIVLRKVCVALKHEDSDQIDILQGYGPKK